MIVTADKAKKRIFLGVSFHVLSYGPDSMITKMSYEKGDIVPFHKHPNEQSGYVVSGKYRIRFGEYDSVISLGDSYTIPKDIEHSIEVIECGQVIDFFTPKRQDYL